MNGGWPMPVALGRGRLPRPSIDGRRGWARMNAEPAPVVIERSRVATARPAQRVPALPVVETRAGTMTSSTGFESFAGSTTRGAGALALQQSAPRWALGSTIDDIGAAELRLSGGEREPERVRSPRR